MVVAVIDVLEETTNEIVGRVHAEDAMVKRMQRKISASSAPPFSLPARMTTGRTGVPPLIFILYFY